MPKIITLLLLTLPALVAAYQPDKLTMHTAEWHCEALAHVSLHPDSAAGITAHVIPTITWEDGYTIRVQYDYMPAIGRSFFCLFRDMRSPSGSLRLQAYGLTGKDGSKVNRVERLE
ncbi:hypothetical protein [Sedimenticola hydrogenitrophicus]|uniref:hypothetical protein n=1 Tax=Sedimenticola hydrogenitrophicus TaxID=2967975 RepID=UPI0023B1A58F|nr:hypothetical protein [Sedimenticola hydrogenitrophicus]